MTSKIEKLRASILAEKEKRALSSDRPTLSLDVEIKTETPTTSSETVGGESVIDPKSLVSSLRDNFSSWIISPEIVYDKLTKVTSSIAEDSTESVARESMTESLDEFATSVGKFTKSTELLLSGMRTLTVPDREVSERISGSLGRVLNTVYTNNLKVISNNSSIQSSNSDIREKTNTVNNNSEKSSSREELVKLRESERTEKLRTEQRENNRDASKNSKESKTDVSELRTLFESVFNDLGTKPILSIENVMTGVASLLGVAGVGKIAGGVISVLKDTVTKGATQHLPESLVPTQTQTQPNTQQTNTSTQKGKTKTTPPTRPKSRNVLGRVFGGRLGRAIALGGMGASVLGAMTENETLESVGDTVAVASTVGSLLSTETGTKVLDKVSEIGKSTVSKASEVGKSTLGKVSEVGAIVGPKISEGTKSAISKVSDVGMRIVPKISEGTKSAIIKGIGTVGTKTALKGLVKGIPLLGALAGLGFGAQRLIAGDFSGAGLEVLGGIAGTVPGVGTALSMATSTALAAKDISELSETNTSSTNTTQTLNEVNASDVTEVKSVSEAAHDVLFKKAGTSFRRTRSNAIREDARLLRTFAESYNREYKLSPGDKDYIDPNKLNIGVKRKFMPDGSIHHRIVNLNTNKTLVSVLDRDEHISNSVDTMQNQTSSIETDSVNSTSVGDSSEKLLSSVEVSPKSTPNGRAFETTGEGLFTSGLESETRPVQTQTVNMPVVNNITQTQSQQSEKIDTVGDNRDIILGFN